jgi:hypothetical protein
MEIELLAHRFGRAPGEWQALRVRASDFAGEKIPAGVGILFSHRGIVPGAQKSVTTAAKSGPDTDS